jgi:methylmalonyl-CoA mutase C-terminal domain/subunit
MVMAVLGMDQHENGAVAASRLLRDAGMEVVYLGRFQLPSHIVTAACDEDADCIGISVHSWEYRHYLPELFELLAQAGAAIPVVVGGSILSPADEEELTRLGAAATFGPACAPDAVVAKVRAVARA